MKFQFQGLDQPIEADWPVTISVPQDGGKVEKREFMARFRLVRPEQVDTILADNEDGLGMERAYWIGFGAGEDQTFTPQLFAQALALPYFRAGLQAAYQKFASGAAAKN